MSLTSASGHLSVVTLQSESVSMPYRGFTSDNYLGAVTWKPPTARRCS